MLASVANFFNPSLIVIRCGRSLFNLEKNVGAL
jgi:hypothetical protein